MQSIEVDSLDRLIRRWEQLLQEIPGKKQELLEDVGRTLLKRVQGRIGGTGTVQSWQGYYVGKKRGYVAIRPKADTYKTTSGGKRYAVGHVTNAFENGHKHRCPGGAARYRARIKTPAVPGAHAYADVRTNLDGVGREELNELLQSIVSALEGGR